MKQLFLNVRFSKLRNGESVGFFRNIVDACETNDANKLQLKSEVTNLTKANADVDNAFNGVFSSKFTEQLLALEARRDDDLRGMRLRAKSAQLDRDANVVKAGNTILKWFDKYGKNIEGQPYRVQTTITRNMCDDAIKPNEFKDALTLIGIDTWMAAMNITNDDFEKKFDERGSDVINNKSKISTSEAVLNANKEYQKLLKTIEARNTLDNTGKYASLIDTINNIIKNTNSTVKAKETASKAARAKKIDTTASK